jgi:hypothetical protein
MPTLPEQGGIMPVLWQPTRQTSLGTLPEQRGAEYTLNIVTTQWIDKGVLFRFQVYDGLRYTYTEALNSKLVQFDLMIREPIPPATILVVCMRETSTAIWGYTGSTQYSNTGPGIPPAYFGYFMSCLAFAFVPTPAGSYSPAGGQPMFAIGFNYYNDESDPGQEGSGCVLTDTTPAALTAPNFPDQHSNTVNPWTFLYEVVYPCLQKIDGTCTQVPGIKFEYATPAYASGSWSNLRNIITQPITIIKDNAESVNRWEIYSSAEDLLPLDFGTPDVGPFGYGCMSGQLAVVYFRPRPQNIDTDSAPTSNGTYVYSTAEIAYLVTSPIPPGQVVYFTVDQYDSINSGFGPRNPTAGVSPFIDTSPSFQWITGSRIVPAGTVVILRNIGGTGRITIEDAHDTSQDVGSVLYNNCENQAIVSIIAIGVWISFGVGTARPIAAGQFVTAALSDQYAGDFPPLSPCLTINRNVFWGQQIYGRRKVFDNMGLPATVQCAMVNNATFELLPQEYVVVNSDLPFFRNMAGFNF